MKPSSLAEIKKELQQLDPQSVADLCVRLARYKKENKELLTYLLFESNDEQAFINGVKEETTLAFKEINDSNLYYAKKSIRKILRNINKHIRYSGLVTTQVELLLFFCKSLKYSGIEFKRSTALNNIYESQLKKIIKALDTMHEDLQYDFKKELKDL